MSTFSTEKTPRVSLVVVGAGRGRRLGCEGAKAFLPLMGNPIVLRTLGVFSGLEFISQRILVVPEGYVELVKSEATKEPLVEELDEVIAGGVRRQDSVARGIAAVDEGCDFVMIHDAVRPFVRREDIVRCVEAAWRAGAAVVGVRAADTLKECDGEGKVLRTVPREGLWAVQTPQVFRREIILEAYEKFGQEDSTDDSGLVEMLGHNVVVVEGRRDNIKVTWEEDVGLGEALLRGKKDQNLP